MRPSGSSTWKTAMNGKRAMPDVILAAMPERCAVLPQRLQRPIRPARALAPESAQGGRGPPSRRARLLRRRPASRRVRPPASMSVSSASVALREAARASAAPRKAPIAPGTVGMQFKHFVHPAVEVEAHDVLDVLPAAEQAGAVADLGVAQHGPHVGLLEVAATSRCQRVGLEHRVAVDGHEDVVLRRRAGRC